MTESAVPYFALLLAATGILAAIVASQIRSYVEAALREADTQHQLKQVEHELQIARSIQQSLLPKLRPQIRGLQWQAGANRRMILAGIFTIGRDCPTAGGQCSWPM